MIFLWSFKCQGELPEFPSNPSKGTIITAAVPLVEGKKKKRKTTPNQLLWRIYFVTWQSPLKNTTNTHTHIHTLICNIRVPELFLYRNSGNMTITNTSHIFIQLDEFYFPVVCFPCNTLILVLAFDPVNTLTVVEGVEP